MANELVFTRAMQKDELADVNLTRIAGIMLLVMGVLSLGLGILWLVLGEDDTHFTIYMLIGGGAFGAIGMQILLRRKKEPAAEMPVITLVLVEGGFTYGGASHTWGQVAYARLLEDGDRIVLYQASNSRFPLAVIPHIKAFNNHEQIPLFIGKQVRLEG